MKDSKFYICNYCYKEFVPKRRRVQKFCSNTCRSKSYHARKTESTTTIITKNNSDIPVLENSKLSDPKMSLSGVGNATVGAITADILKSVFTQEDNKPATKKDLKIILNKLSKRYHKINNLEKEPNGALPYFDMHTNTIIYSNLPL